VNAYRADDPEQLTVVITADQFRLPDVLRHVEAGRTVIVVPPGRHPPPAAS
jgi:hypothetical protein